MKTFNKYLNIIVGAVSELRFLSVNPVTKSYNIVPTNTEFIQAAGAKLTFATTVLANGCILGYI